MQNRPANSRLIGQSGRERTMVMLNNLPPLSAISPNGLRFVAQPTFGDTYFSLIIKRTPTGGAGVLHLYQRNNVSETRLPDQSFEIQIPLAVYLGLESDLDQLITNWDGEDSLWLDGTVVVIERVKNGQISSGVGNSPDFYGLIGALIYNAVRPSVPQLGNFETDWHPRERDGPSQANGS